MTIGAAEDLMLRVDYDSVYAAMDSLSACGWSLTTPNQRTDGWASLVSHLEGKPSGRLHDYFGSSSLESRWGHRLGMRTFVGGLVDRQWLSLMLPMVTVSVRSARQRDLDALDDRFRRQTSWTDIPWGAFFEDAVSDNDDWWWRRCPSALAAWTDEQIHLGRDVVDTGRQENRL